MADLHRQYEQWSQVTAQERARLTTEYQDGVKALAAGQNYAVPESEIRRLYPPEKASEMLRDAALATEQGAMVKQVQWASPQELARLNAQHNEGLANADNWEQKARGKATFDHVVDQRNKALAHDPAAYVATSPPVQQAKAARAADPTNPELYQAEIDASLAEQNRLGAPVSQEVTASGEPKASPHGF